MSGFLTHSRRHLDNEVLGQHLWMFVAAQLLDVLLPLCHCPPSCFHMVARDFSVQGSITVISAIPPPKPQFSVPSFMSSLLSVCRR